VVTQLERDLGVRLLERTTRSLSMTEAGREIFERAVGILGAVEDVERVAQRIHAQPRGVLKLTCGVEFGMIAVSRWIDAYLRQFPLVSVEADFTGRVVDIVHEGFDLAIRVGELPDSRLAARRIGELKYGLFAGAAYLERRGMPQSPMELPQHELLMFTAGSHASGWRLSRGTEQHRVDASARLRINNSFSVRDAAIAGLGIAQLPLLVANDSAVSGALVRVLPEWIPPAVPIHALFPSSRYLTPKVRAFIDLAVAAHAGDSGSEGGA
jgi:DNA-binding transcriptional LysR family regulator